MAENSKIQWTHHTFNPWIGCTKVSDLCKNCYAEVQTFARVQRGRGRELWGSNAERHRTSAANWKEPRRWSMEAARAGERRRVFCASLSDVFEDRRDLDPWRADLWRLIEETPMLDWLLLTKRPQNVLRLAPVELLRSCWVGYSGIDPDAIQALREVPALVRFLSLEPLLRHVDIDDHLDEQGHESGGPQGWIQTSRGIDWVIVGGESGPGARPCDVTWVRAIVEQCQAAAVPVFVKQLGAFPLGVPSCFYCENAEFEGTVCEGGCGDVTEAHDGRRVLHLKDRKGGDPSEWPRDLNVRQFPEVPVA